MQIAMIGQKGIPALYGGVERHVEMLARELAEEGHTVTVYARRWYSSGEHAPKDHRIRRIITGSIHTQYLDTITHELLAIFHALFRPYDVIHFHGVGPALLAWIPRFFKPRTRIIVTVHSLNREHPGWNSFGRAVLRLGEWAAVHFPHRTIVVAQYLRTYFRRVYGVDTVVIPNGIDVARRPPPVELLKSWKLSPKIYGIFVGRLVETKGVHTLLGAWELLQKDHPALMREKKLVIVGDAHFSEVYVARLRHMAAHDPSVIFTGWQEGPALDSLIAHAAFLVQPSVAEGLPLTLLEAMAYGVPTLVSDIPAHREIITEPALRFPVGDTRALAARILEMHTDVLWYKKYGAKNKDLALRTYRWDAIAKKTLDVYRK